MIVGIGVDIIEIDRMQKAMDRWGTHFLEYVFNADEIDYARQFKFPAQHYAVRFAAKEAIYKAMGGHVSLTWRDVSILNNKDGQPFCVFKKEVPEYQCLISLSHSKYYAVANALVTS